MLCVYWSYVFTAICWFCASSFKCIWCMCLDQSQPLRWDGFRHTPIFINTPLLPLLYSGVDPTTPQPSPWFLLPPSQALISAQTVVLADGTGHWLIAIVYPTVRNCWSVFCFSLTARCSSSSLSLFLSPLSLALQIQILAPISTMIKESQVNSVYIGCLFMFKISCICLVFRIYVLPLYMRTGLLLLPTLT